MGLEIALMKHSHKSYVAVKLTVSLEIFRVFGVLIN